MKKYILTVIFLVSATFLFAQVNVRHNMFVADVDTDRGTFRQLNLRSIVPENAVSFNLGYGIPTINNALTNQDFWDKGLGTGLSFGVNYRRHLFTSNIVDGREVRQPTLFGAGVGLGISHLSQQAVMNYNHTEILHNFVDRDGYVADVTLSYRGIRERVSLTYLDIPLYLEIGRLSQTRLSGFFNAGVRASILVSNQFTGEGTFTSTGFYRTGELTGYTLRDIPSLNYFTNRSAYLNPEYDLSSFVLWGSVSGGINIPFSSLERNWVSPWVLRVGVRVDYTLTPISRSIPEPYFTGADFRINQSNMLGGNGSRVFRFGLDVRLIYCF